jgi:hypothetical protein
MEIWCESMGKWWRHGEDMEICMERVGTSEFGNLNVRIQPFWGASRKWWLVARGKTIVIRSVPVGHRWRIIAAKKICHVGIIITNWWFQPPWKILVRLDHHHNYWKKINNVPNHQPDHQNFEVRTVIIALMDNTVKVLPQYFRKHI